MKMDIRQILGVNIQSPYWEQAYRLALQEPEQPDWLTEKYLRQMHNDWGILPENLEVLVSALRLLVQEKPLCLFIKTLLHILELHKPFGECFSEFEMPAAPDGTENTLAYDCIGIFPLLAHVPVVREEMAALGIDPETLRQFFAVLDSGVSECTESAGRPYYSKYYFSAHWSFVFYQSLTIGRLRFERAEQTVFPVRIFINAAKETEILMDGVTVHRSGHILGAGGCTDTEGSFDANFAETEDAYEGYPTDRETGLVKPTRIRLLKSRWRMVYRSGDGIMKVHVPFRGRLDRELCAQSYQKARELFKCCFPEYTSAGFTINTWLLAPELNSVLREDSNILAFGRDYHKFPMASSGKDIFEYVFKQSVPELIRLDVESLPETTSLQRNVKDMCRKGVIFHEFGGFIPW